ncbi:MAG: glycosyltransferase [Pyrinomonadaceae bacterium]
MTFLNLQNLHEKLVESPVKPKCFFTIVIPVRNEAKYIGETLKSFSCQVDLENQPLDFRQFEIIFLVNNSSDESAEIIRRQRDKNQFPIIHLAEKNLPAEQSNVGYVRRWLMNEAFLRLRFNKFSGGIIATTDGDSEIAPDWIAATVAEIRLGADAVGGRIFIKPDELRMMNAKCRAFHLRDTGYRLLAAEVESRIDYLAHDAPPRHHQHFNGSFAVTTSAFEKAGGVPQVRFLEDVAFYHALLRVDARFRHSPSVRVQTSARSEGRTESGLSTQIGEWTTMGQNGVEYLVESAAAIERRLRARKNLRCSWREIQNKNRCQKDKIKTLAGDLLIPFEYLQNEISAPQTFGSLYEKVLCEQNQNGEWKKENSLTTVEKAISDLRSLLEKFRRGERKFSA